MTEINDIVEDFELLGDWDARYQYLVELGEALLPYDDALRTDANRVQGCISKVWVNGRIEYDKTAGGIPVVIYIGDCDTAVIKGVVALLVDLLSGRTPQDIVSLDVDQLFERLQLAEHLSPNRHFGIYAIVDLMKKQAKGLAESLVTMPAAS